MPDSQRRPTSITRALLAALAIAMLAGCAQMQGWLQSSRREVPESGVILGAPTAEQYIEEMYRLTTGDPATQAEIYADAEAAASLTPDPSSKLRLALVLAAPAHSESDPERAQDIFRDLLSQVELLTTAEISLASIHLREVERRLSLARETERLRAEALRNASSEQRAIEQRLAQVESENRRLRSSLSEAEQKLEAITTIERSIREQSENGDQQ